MNETQINNIKEKNKFIEWYPLTYKDARFQNNFKS